MCEEVTNVKIFGFGDAGCAAADALAKELAPFADLYAVHSDAAALARSICDNKILLEAGEGGGTLSEQTADKIRIAATEANIIIMIVGLMDGAVSAAINLVAEAAERGGALTAAVSAPFGKSAGADLNEYSVGIEELKSRVGALIALTGGAFSEIEEPLTEAVKGLILPLKKPSAINLDYGDLRLLLNKGGAVYFGYGASAGEGRARSAAEHAAYYPLCAQTLKSAKSILVYVAADYGFDFKEAERVVEIVRGEADPSCSVVFAADLREELNGEFRVCVYGTDNGAESK